jgi:hypothetical protein
VAVRQGEVWRAARRILMTWRSQRTVIHHPWLALINIGPT